MARWGGAARDPFGEYAEISLSGVEAGGNLSHEYTSKIGGETAWATFAGAALRRQNALKMQST